jgi:hypothetical protein
MDVIESIDVNQKFMGFPPLERQIDALVTLVPYLSEPLLHRGLAVARASEKAFYSLKTFYQAWAIGEIALKLPEPLKDPLQQEAVTIARTVEYLPNRVGAFLKLLPGLPGENRSNDFSVLSKLLSKTPNL